MGNFTRLHEQLLVEEILSNRPTQKQTALIRHAGDFFAATITAVGVEKGKDGARDSALLKKSIKSLSGRTVELATANRKLAIEVAQRKRAEKKARKSERDLSKSLEKSEILRNQLRGLSRQFLTVQEEERKNISRELHDVVAQALMGINVRLGTLKAEAGLDTKELVRNITRTQKMITKSAEIVHQFVCELRPAVLDDLGLIPALHSFMKGFTTRTGVRTGLTAFKEVEELHTVKLTVFYRVAQEALTNVARHAQASKVKVVLRKEPKHVTMEVIDNGCSFPVEQVLSARESKCLGLLGMRERVEMVGGHFSIESAPGTGTKVIARIPVRKSIENKWRIEAAAAQAKTL